MNARPRISRFLLLTLALVGSWLLPACGGEDENRNARTNSKAVARAGVDLKDRPVADPVREIIDIAIDVAASLPKNPHAKTRSRLQASVAQACLELERPVSALRVIEKIEDWRRGVGYAELAFHLAEKGDDAGAEYYLELATQEADRVLSAEAAQEWRRDRIRVAIARCWVLLGDPEEAAHLETDLDGSEWGKVDLVRADKLPAEDFDRQVKDLDAVFATANLDQARAALETFVVLHDRFYADEDRRRALTDRIETSYEKLPMDIRLDLMMRLAEQAIAHGDGGEALRLTDKATEFAGVGNWLPELRIPLDARLAALRFRAGDAAGGRSRMDEARAFYTNRRGRIVDVFRAEALWPLARAFHDIGNDAAALEVYKLAVAESIVNPNSRPRAEDLTAICRSVVLSGIAPDEELIGMIRSAREGLGQPW